MSTIYRILLVLDLMAWSTHRVYGLVQLFSHYIPSHQFSSLKVFDICLAFVVVCITQNTFDSISDSSWFSVARIFPHII